MSESGAVDPRVAAALARLDDLESRPVREHVDIYDEVHGQLRSALADAAGAPGAPGAPGGQDVARATPPATTPG